MKDFITENLLSQSLKPACEGIEELTVAVSRTLKTAVSESQGKFVHLLDSHEPEVYKVCYCDHTMSVVVHPGYLDCERDRGRVSDQIFRKICQILFLYKTLCKVLKKGQMRSKLGH